MSSYSFKNTLGLGPVSFGPTTSGTGSVVFGSASPTLTSAVQNLTSNPIMLAVVAAALIAGVWIIANGKRGIKL